MTESAGTRFLDGLRVTARHLNHVEETTDQASHDLRRVLGVGQIGYGFRRIPSNLLFASKTARQKD